MFRRFSAPLGRALGTSLTFGLALSLAACGGSSSGGGDDDGDRPDAGTGETIEGLTSLTIAPSSATVTAEGTTQATQDFTASGTFADGSTRDVTSKVSFSVDDTEVGGFAGGRFSTSNLRGGYTTVRARAGSIIASAQLMVIIKQRQVDPSPLPPGVDPLPADPGGPFGGPADAARAPSLVYPADGVLLPPNLGKLEIHFRPGTDNTLFAIDFASPVTDVTIFTRCANPLNGGCIYRPSDEVWRWIAHSNRGTLDGVKITVRGTNDAGTGVGTSGAITAAFSQDDIKGGIYYWVTGRVVNGQREPGGSIMRFDFAEQQTEAEAFIDTAVTGLLPDGTAPPPCGVGCHALSRDGKKLVAAAGGGSTDGRMLVVDVERNSRLVYPTATETRKNIAFSTWNPDGTQFASTFGNGSAGDGFTSYDINLFNGTTGLPEGIVAVGATQTSPAVHPDWSPDGNTIAFTKATTRDDTSTAQRMRRTSIGVVSRDGAAWGTAVTLVAGAPSKGACYPAFSPSSDLLAFGRSTCASGDGADCDCYDDPRAEVWVMTPEMGATPVELVNANTDATGKVQSSYPKWSPFTFRRVDEQDSRLQWMTFSSKRNYGLYTPQTGQTLIWMAAVDPDKGLAGLDPSFPAFALPFQGLDTSNHTAQWAERVIPDVD
jgi:hypothetical protein